MKNGVLHFFSTLRQIFGVCPCCGDVFRASDCKLYQKTKPTTDWKEKLDYEISRLDNLENKILEKIELTKEFAREQGRKEADKIIKKIDPVFKPLKLNPNDAKVIFHPVDYVVFNGMNNNSGDSTIKNIVLLDKSSKKNEFLTLQKSIENSILKSNYEWLTLRVNDNGTITEE